MEYKGVMGYRTLSPADEVGYGLQGRWLYLVFLEEPSVLRA